MALSPECICRRAALCRAAERKIKAVPWFDAVRLGQSATGARSEGTACAVMHSLRVGVHNPMVLREPATLAGVPAVHRRSAAVARASRRSWSRFNAARVEWLAWSSAHANPAERATVGAARRCGIPLARTPFGTTIDGSSAASCRSSFVQLDGLDASDGKWRRQQPDCAVDRRG
jgi:hypothetical protein